MKDSASPISLLELGLYENSRKIVVCCENGFYRKGNVEIVCKRYNIPAFDSFQGAVDEVVKLYDTIKHHEIYQKTL